MKKNPNTQVRQNGSAAGGKKQASTRPIKPAVFAAISVKPMPDGGYNLQFEDSAGHQLDEVEFGPETMVPFPDKFTRFTLQGDASTEASVASAAQQGKTKPEPTQEEMEAWHAMRQRKMASPLYFNIGSAHDLEVSDEILAEYLGTVISNYTPDFHRLILAKNAGADCLAMDLEILVIARAVADWKDHYKKYGADGVKIPRPIPTTFSLPGLARHMKFAGARDVLDCMAFLLDQYRLNIIEKIQGGVWDEDPIGRIELLEALMVAQQVTDRAGGDDEVEACEKIGQPTALEKLVQQARADYYKGKIDEVCQKLAA